MFENKFNMSGVFCAMYINNGQEQGTAILSKHAIKSTSNEYYLRQTEELLTNIVGDTPMSGAHCSLLSIKIEIQNADYNIITTHFPVHYPGHEVSEFQRECFKKMNTLLQSKSNFILTGDTNCPRGTEIFDTLARQYTDNIPRDAITTIDKNIHRAGFLPYVVDCLFTTPEYIVEKIELVDGISDHMAVIAEITKTS